MRFRTRPAALAAAALVLASAAAAAPQGKPEAKPPAAAGDVQAFGDWTLRCGTGPSGERACEVSSMVKRPGAQGPIAQIAFGRQVKADKPGKDAKPEKDAKSEKDKAKPSAAEKPAAAAAPQPDAPAQMKLVVLIPVNVTIAPGVELSAEAGASPVKMPIKTCIQAACFAETLMTEDEVKAFRGRAQPGKLVFSDPGENQVSVEVSFKGLDEALAALAGK